MLSVPGKNPADGVSLTEILKRDYPDARAVHRLDQATSGIIVFALGLDALRALSRQFEHRETRKHYIAKVAGIVREAAGDIYEPLICDYPNRPRQKICYDHGKPSHTQWEVMRHTDDGHSILALTPITGRSHQLRVHCAHIGHPIIGDRLYAPPDIQAQSPRMELYAVLLEIRHPVTSEPMIFSTPSPYDPA